MIIFTATHKVTERVFVGNARDDLSLYWEELVSYAESDTPGVFFELLKDGGRSAFDLDEFGYAENPSEARELIQEAREELDAALIKVPKNATRKVATTSSVAVAEVKALLQGLNDSEPASPWEEELTDWTEDETHQQSPEGPKNTPSAPLNTTAKDPSPTVNRATNRVRALVEKQVPRVTTKESASESISSGKTTSSKKEKRIKEAIEQERESRFEARRRKEREEYEAMRDVCLRIESQRLSNKQNIKRAKELAAKRKVRAEKETAAATQSATDKSASTTRRKTTTPRPPHDRTPSVEHFSLSGVPETNAAGQTGIASVVSAPAALAIDPKKAAAQRQREDIKHLLAFIAVKRVELNRTKMVNAKVAIAANPSTDHDALAAKGCSSETEPVTTTTTTATTTTAPATLFQQASSTKSAEVVQSSSLVTSTEATDQQPLVNKHKPLLKEGLTSDASAPVHAQRESAVDAASRLPKEADFTSAPSPESDDVTANDAARPKRPQVLNLQSSTNGMMSTESKSIKVVTKRRLGEKATTTSDMSDTSGFGSRTASARSGRLSLKRS